MTFGQTLIDFSAFYFFSSDGLICTPRGLQLGFNRVEFVFRNRRQCF